MRGNANLETLHRKGATKDISFICTTPKITSIAVSTYSQTISPRALKPLLSSRILPKKMNKIRYWCYHFIDIPLFSFGTITGTGSPIPPVPCQKYGKPSHKELPPSDRL